MILAGITISGIIGNNGVLNQAEKSKIRTDQASAKEDIDMEVAGCYDNNGNIDLGVLNDRLKKKGGVSFKKTGESEFVELKDGEDGEDGNYIEELPVTVKYKDVEVEIEGEYTGGVDRSKPITSLNESDYGKYINYPIDTDGDNNPNNNWRIFYKDDNGNIFIKAADYLTEQKCDVLKEATDKAGMKQYNEYVYRWEKPAVYHCNDGRKDAKFNVTEIEDEENKENKVKKPQCSFPEIFMPSGSFCKKDGYEKEHYYCSDHVGTDGISGNSNSRCASALQCTENWSSFVSGEAGKYGQYAIGGPTLEMWVASWNQKHGTETEVDTVKKGITLYVDGGNNSDDVYGYKTITSLNSYSGYSDTLYFPHKKEKNDLDGDGLEEKCRGYWLASPAASGGGVLIQVQYNGSMSFYLYNNTDYGVCPVVFLKSGVRVEWKDGTEGENSGYYELVK